MGEHKWRPRVAALPTATARRAGGRSAGCPACGSRQFTKVRVDPNETVITKPRICAQCGLRYVVPLPRWVGLLTYVAAVAVVALMLVDWFAHPDGVDMTFTWKGRLGMVAFAGFLGWMGTEVIRGRT